MIINACEVHNIAEIHTKILNKNYDFIIVGSGPAAISLYKSLIKKNLFKILIIEKGNFEKNKYEKIKYTSLPIKKKSRVFAVGGTSNLWSNISSYFEKTEMKLRYKKKNRSVWPLTDNDLIKLYKKIDKSYGFNFSKIKLLKVDIPFKVRNFIGKINPIKFKDFIKTSEVDLIYNCEVLTIDEYKNKASIDFMLKQKIEKIFSKKVILCCGGIESTALILKSLENNKIKMLRNKKMVGRNFMEHPKFTLGFLKYPKINLIKKLELKYNKENLSYFGVSMTNKDQRMNNILNSYVRFEKTYFNFEIKRNLFTIFQIFKYLFIKNIKIKKKVFYKIRLFTEMLPNLNNKISICKKTKKIIVDYKLSKKDLKTIELLSSSVYKFFSVKPDLEKIEPISKLNYEDSSHHMGGLCFSKDSKKTLVDKNLKLMGTKNIYICSSAIFPTSGSANPTMTICALSIRLGNYLANQIKKDYEKKNFNR